MNRFCSAIHNYCANFSPVKILLHFFFCFSTSSCLCFPWSEWYFILISGKILWSNPSSICFSFNHNIPSLSTITSIPYLSNVFSAYINHVYIIYSIEVSGFFISSFISLYSLNRLFTERNSSWLIYESIKALNLRTLIVINLSILSNTILSCFFFFFITDLYFLNPAVIAQIFIPTAELILPTRAQTNEANAEIETQSVISRLEYASVKHNLNTYMSSYIFNSLNHCVLFHLNIFVIKIYYKRSIFYSR